MLNADLELDLILLESSGIITTSEKNLRSKIESINRSLENLNAKRDRIDFEIKKQKRSLVRKREELKRVSKRLKTKTSLLQESEDETSSQSLERCLDIQKLDSILLQDSNQMLEI